MVFCLGLEVRMARKEDLGKAVVVSSKSICKMLHQMRRFFQVLLCRVKRFFCHMLVEEMRELLSHNIL